MGLLSFLKDAGENLFNLSSQKESTLPSTNRKAEIELSIFNYIQKQQLKAKNLLVSFDEASHTVIVKGIAPDQVTHEKILLCCGNIHGVEAVDDQMEVEEPQDSSQWYTVAKGDSLSKIALEFYGDANKYPLVYEANQPMLTNPDKIYPGQVLRIPSIH